MNAVCEISFLKPRFILLLGLMSCDGCIKAGPRHVGVSPNTQSVIESISLVTPADVFVSPERCELSPKTLSEGVRVATWNVRQFGPETNLKWLACLIAAHDFDLIALQEITFNEAGTQALAHLLSHLQSQTQRSWKSQLDACPRDGRMGLGFIYSHRLTLEHVETLREANPTSSMCGGMLRPGLYGQWSVDQRGGQRLFSLVNLHLDSGTTQRDYKNRMDALQGLRGWLARHESPVDFLVGDFNVMGCTQCGASPEHESRLSMHDFVNYREASSLATCTQYSREHGFVKLDRMFANRQSNVKAIPIAPTQTCMRQGVARYLREISDHFPLAIELAP